MGVEVESSGVDDEEDPEVDCALLFELDDEEKQDEVDELKVENESWDEDEEQRSIMLELGGEEDPEVECLGALLLELDDEGKQDEVDDLKQNDEVESESWGEDEEQSIMGT